MSGLLQTVEQTVGAGAELKQHTRAQFMRVLEGGGLDISILKGGAIVGQASGVDSGFYIKAGEVFDEVRIYSAVAQVVKFTLGNAEVGSADAVSVSGDVSVVLPVVPFVQTAQAITAASAQLLAANASRKFLMIQNRDTAVNAYLNLSGDAATVAAGIKLAPGASLVLDVCCPNEAIFLIGDAAGTVDLVAVEG